MQRVTKSAANIKNNSRSPPKKNPPLACTNGGLRLLFVDRRLDEYTMPF
jgi:hypothetical protein